jgi:hypothetical protein
VLTMDKPFAAFIYSDGVVQPDADGFKGLEFSSGAAAKIPIKSPKKIIRSKKVLMKKQPSRERTKLQVKEASDKGYFDKEVVEGLEAAKKGDSELDWLIKFCEDCGYIAKDNTKQPLENQATETETPDVNNDLGQSESWDLDPTEDPNSVPKSGTPKENPILETSLDVMETVQDGEPMDTNGSPVEEDILEQAMTETGIKPKFGTFIGELKPKFKDIGNTTLFKGIFEKVT